ncbi:MAG: MotA/TolQ/ExbB proton channel family protein [Chlamydiia bacterium]|nr:MotA/TolQ/ExbB proton channel family protein [Chlamydiia bacterium]
MLHNYILASNPFFDAYFHSDFLGKVIFLSIILLSIITWIVIGYKGWLLRQVKRNCHSFRTHFLKEKRSNPLALEYRSTPLNPYGNLYVSLKTATREILHKNRYFGQQEQNVASLSADDIDLVEARLETMIANEVKFLDQNLFILSTIVALAPFLGLLGTVWGILTAFSEMQVQSGITSSQTVIGALSLALATTVLGLIDAIPALIGYNTFKDWIRRFEIDLEQFSHELLSAVELQYRRVEG